MRQAEHRLYVDIAQYLQDYYPDIIYRFDLAADMKLTPGQAAKHRRLHPERGYPDLFIAAAKQGKNGLYLELKAEGNSPYRKDGTLKKDEHLEEQQKMLNRLKRAGYRAEFATGFVEARKKIEDYLGKPEEDEIPY